MMVDDRPKALSLSPRSKRVERPTTIGGAGGSTAPADGSTVTKKQKTGPSSAVAAKVEPSSTPRKPLGTNGADILAAATAGGSAPPASASASQQQAAAIKAAGRRDKEAKMASLKQDEQDFINKYTRAFPNFVFHFDSVEPGPFGAKARELGARIDKFFSRSVTHVITSRAVPTFKDKENAPPAAAAAARRVTIGGTDVRSAASKSSKLIANPFLDETGQSDVLLKALTFKMKVWDVKKFQSVINRLLPADVSPKKARVQSRHTAASAGQSAAATLSHLLEDERKNGTRERDQSAPRPDYQYFQRNAFYVLCEDATGEYRTVIAREYERPRNGDYPEWPVLHETFLKPSASKFAPPPPPPAPPAPTAPHAAGEERPISGLPARQARLARLFKGVTGTDGADPNLRRSASLNNLGRASKLATLDDTRHPAAAENDGAYIAASGNSVNITSTTTSAQSGAGAGNTFDRQGREKAIAELNRKQVAFLPRAAAGSTASAAAASGPVAAEGGGGSSRPISTVVGEPSSVRKRKTKAAMAAVVQAEEEARAAAILEAKVRADHARRELKGTGKMDPPPMKKRHSLPADLTAGAKEKVRLPPREETKKPGYCENCRNKFDDFATHIKSRRHRRFALNDDHFTDLDKVLARLDRQVLGRPRLPQYDRLHLDEEVSSEEEDEDAYSEFSSGALEEEEEEERRRQFDEQQDELGLCDLDDDYPPADEVDAETCQHEWELVVDDEDDGGGDMDDGGDGYEDDE